MAQSYYSVEEAAKVLGVSADEIKRMRERQEIYGMWSGSAWKFKVDDIDRIARERQEGGAAVDDNDDVLLNERELGQAGQSSSGTVIGLGGGKKAAHESDIQIAPEAAGNSDMLTHNELELAADDDLSLADATVDLSDLTAGKGAAHADDLMSDSALDLGGDTASTGSGSGSDVTIGGNSGISLVSTADSGLPLDQLSGSESLELSDDDILTTAEEANLTSPTQLRADDDFLLTPLAEAGDEDDSASGSQVIALDTEGGDEAGIGGAAGGMLDEDAVPNMGVMMGAALAGGAAIGVAQAGAFPDGGLIATMPGAPEAPYSVLDVVLLVLGVVLLSLSGMMVYDLVRNMWSWDNGPAISSSLMDFVLGLIDK